ncbi:hypothetical protein [Spirosoma luteum]|uniref:hypothetical protein n=1 Tax=Spirosoma luteum TaxID=431553 RepID=UPI00146F3FAB|nr:hypothetical protein [Spirosoma luteum]
MWTLEEKHKTLGGFLSEELHGHFGTAGARSFSAQTYWLTSYKSTFFEQPVYKKGYIGPKTSAVNLKAALIMVNYPVGEWFKKYAYVHFLYKRPGGFSAEGAIS